MNSSLGPAITRASRLACVFGFLQFHTFDPRLTMVRPPTQQTVDRIVGTVAVLGLSVAAIRWLSHASKQRQSRQQLKKLPWWWPMIALRRRKDRRAKNHRCGGIGDDDNGDLEQSKAREKNLEGGYEHRGSCHCRSIHFLVSTCCHIDVLYNCVFRCTLSAFEENVSLMCCLLYVSATAV